MDPTKVIIPPLKDLNIENITDNVILINSQNPDARLKYVLERLVTHLHDFARETRLSEREWMAGLQFLTTTGQTCTDVRQVCKHINLTPYIFVPRKPWTLICALPQFRNLSFYPMCSASPSWSTPSTTPSQLRAPRAQCSAHSTPTRPRT